MQAHVSKSSPKKHPFSHNAQNHHNDTPIAFLVGNFTFALCCPVPATIPTPSFPTFAFQLATKAPNPA
jgi:hypothetical protein